MPGIFLCDPRELRAPARGDIVPPSAEEDPQTLPEQLALVVSPWRVRDPSRRTRIKSLVILNAAKDH